ncbi:MAG: glycosyltransferase family 4 protein [Gammaproteobacteria bacterium]|nr:glycosyltransferase family 4 protein [Gammaproteobacteria bacterium]
MNFWIVTVGEPLPGFSGTSRPWRSGLLAALLAERGHTVTWWVSTVDHFSKSLWMNQSCSHTVSENLELQFLHGCLYRRNVSIARYRNHRQIAREFSRIALTRERPDLVLCSYPPIELSEAAVAYAAARDIPVYLDIRDLWPDEILTRVPDPARPVARLALAPLYRAAQRAVRGATGLIGISQAYLDWGLRMAGRHATAQDLVIPLGYTGNLDRIRHSPATERRLRDVGVDPGKQMCWFSGTFVGNIDLGTVIEAARLLADREDIQFVFSGSGERDTAWRRQAAGLNNVIFTGWVGSEELAWLSTVAWAGLGAYKPNATMSLPNKLFEYMSMGLPILLSLGGEAERLVTDHGLGDCYRAGDAGHLAALVRQRSTDTGWRSACSRNGRELFQSTFSPDIVYRRYADTLEDRANARS